MPESSTASADVRLIRLEASKLLARWWLSLHGLLGLAAVAANWPGWLAAVALAGLALNCRLRWPRSATIVLVDGAGRFDLPADGRFGLRLARRSRAGTGWLSLVFDDKPSPLLILSDQLEPEDWRRLRLAVTDLR